MISFATSQVITGGRSVSIRGLTLPSVQRSAASAVFAAANLSAPNEPPGLSATASPYSLPVLVPVLTPARTSSDEARTPGPEEIQPVEPITITPATDGLRVGPDQKRVSYDVAFNKIAENNAKVTTELEHLHELTRAQGRGWYRASVSAAAVGMSVLAAAVIVLILGQVTTGIVTTIASVVPNALASMFFVNSRRADDRVDALTKRLTGFREAAAMVDIAQLVADPKLQDDLKAQIVRKVLANP